MNFFSAQVIGFTLCAASTFLTNANAQIATGGGSSCPSFVGTNTYDSTAQLFGDPFQGGSWANNAGGHAYAKRTLSGTTTVKGFYLGSAGSDITSSGSVIQIILTRPDGTTFTALNLREVAVNRAFSGGASATTTGPLTVQFPEVQTKKITVNMSGNGYFLLERLNFFLSQC